MIKKGDNEIKILYKGDTEIIKLYVQEQLIYDADKIYAYIDGDTLIFITDSKVSFDSVDSSLILRNKPMSKAEFKFENSKKIINIEQYER